MPASKEKNNGNAKNPDLVLEQILIGHKENFNYLIGSKKAKKVYLVDPAWDIPHLEARIKDLELNIAGVLITHGHADHTNGIEEILKSHDVPVYVSKHEASFCKPSGKNIYEVESNFELVLGDIKIKFLHTPGHTPGSQCFIVDDNLIAGDTLFIDGCGRCDMQGGDVELMYDSISNKLMKLPDNTLIFPGHNYHEKPSDSLEKQKETNPYMKCKNLHEFISLRMG